MRWIKSLTQILHNPTEDSTATNCSSPSPVLPAGQAFPFLIDFRKISQVSSSRLVETVKLTKLLLQVLLQVPVPAPAAASSSDGHRGAVLPLGSTEGTGKDTSLALPCNEALLPLSCSCAGMRWATRKQGTFAQVFLSSHKGLKVFN